MTTILPTLIRVISRKSNRMGVGEPWIDRRAGKPWDIGYVSFTVDYEDVKYLVFIHRFNRGNVAIRLMQYVNHLRVQKYFTMFDIAKMPNIRKIGIHLVWAIKKGIFESVMEDQ